MSQEVLTTIAGEPISVDYEQYQKVFEHLKITLKTKKLCILHCKPARARIKRSCT